MGGHESKYKPNAGGDGVQKKIQDLNKSYSPLMSYVHDNVVGDGVTFEGPYGKRAVVYCDYTASGRPLRCIENYISQYVYPYYANTHTTTCITAQQTTQFRNDAKLMIKRAVNASEEDVVIFTGSGTTGAIHKLIGVLELKKHAKQTVVFVSPFEHHSNLLPWKECGAEVVRILDNRQGALDMNNLEINLKKYKEKGLRMIASFSAASNITGIMLDTISVSEMCHKYGALSFWDYATAAPYLEIDMNKSGQGYKDAVFISPHKFVGGPGSPGILIAKKSLFTNAVPHAGGGGTVLYVIKGQHMYVDDIESREEGGTPAIIESIRAGLCFQLKQDIGPKAIEEREHTLYEHAKAIWTKVPNMAILGPGRLARLPIFSFIVKYMDGSTKYLHHNYVAILLNDLFGIQARGGCACAGPYAEGLLGINGKDFTVFLEGAKDIDEESVADTASVGDDKLEQNEGSKDVDKKTVDGAGDNLEENKECKDDALCKDADTNSNTQDVDNIQSNGNILRKGNSPSKDSGLSNGSSPSKNSSPSNKRSHQHKKKEHLEIMKPGFVRLNLPYFMNTEELVYIIKAVEMLCEHGWKLLPLYKFDAVSGVWSHREHMNTIMKMRDVSFTANKMKTPYHTPVEVVQMDQKYFENCLDVAQKIFDKAHELCRGVDTKRDQRMAYILPEDKSDFCWFVEPWQAAVDLALEGTQYTSESLSNGGKRKKNVFNPRQMSVFADRSSLGYSSFKKARDRLSSNKRNSGGSGKKLTAISEEERTTASSP